MSRDTYNIGVGKRLRNARRYLGLTQAKMAEELNICEETFRRMEKGVISLTAERLEYLHSTYNINPEYIVSGTESEDVIKKVEESLLSCNDEKLRLELARNIINDVINVLAISDLRL